MKNSSLIVQFMTLLEDFTPIKPLEHSEKYYQPGNMMSQGGLFTLRHQQIMALAAVGLFYAALKIIFGV